MSSGGALRTLEYRSMPVCAGVYRGVREYALVYARFKMGVFLCVLGHTDVSVGTSVGGYISM